MKQHGWECTLEIEKLFMQTSSMGVKWDTMRYCGQDRWAVDVTMSTFCSIWFVSADILYTIRNIILWNYAWKTFSEIVAILKASLNCALNSLRKWCITHSYNLYSNTFPPNYLWFLGKIEWHLIILFCMQYILICDQISKAVTVIYSMSTQEYIFAAVFIEQLHSGNICQWVSKRMEKTKQQIHQSLYVVA